MTIISKLTSKEIGQFGEMIAKSYLIKKGFYFIDQNVHFSHAEIDLIFENSTQFIFVEVKLRRSDKYGKAIEQITGTKLKNMRKCIEMYQYQIKVLKEPRIDMVFIDIIKNTVEISHFIEINF
jgi:putative endonuclease